MAIVHTDVSTFGAEDGIRTRDPDLGKVVLYQLSYFRIAPFWHPARWGVEHPPLGHSKNRPRGPY